MPKPRRPLERMLLEKRQQLRRRKTKPIRGIKWIDNVENAYRARTRLVKFFDRSNIDPKKVVHLLKLEELWLTPAQIAEAHVEISKDSPAINVFVTGVEGRYDGESFVREIPGVGMVYFNVIYRDKKSDVFDGVARHEEAHVNTRLLKELSPEINSLTDVKDGLRHELISRLAEFYPPGAKAGEDSIQERLFFESVLLGYLKLDMKTLLGELQKNRPEKYSGARTRYAGGLVAQTNKIIRTIRGALIYLPLQELLMVLRQTSWPDIPRVLNERVILHAQYEAKLRRKKKI